MATHPLGVLGTDAAGYASFDLARLPAPVRAAVTAAMRALTLAGAGPAAAGAPEPEAAIWIYPYGSRGARFDALAQGRFAPDAIVMRQDMDAVTIPDEVRNLGLASMQDPDLIDWRISPGSFSTNPVGLVGADGCETLLPSNVAVQEFNFYQVIGVSDASAQPPEAQGAVKVGFVNDFRLSWIPIGHALGQILYSVPLAPGESMKLAVIDWTRRDAALRTETTKLDESLVHDERRDRVISETVKASIDEWQRGGSVTGGLATSSGGSYGGFGVGAAVGGSDAIGGSYSTSSGSRDIAGNTVQQLSDNVAQASSASRELYSTVVVQTSQSENETIETRTIANYNHSHALTFLYYEILRNFRVVSQFVGRRPVVLVPIKTDWFDGDAALQNIVELRSALTATLLRPELADGFDAVQRLSALDSKDPRRQLETPLPAQPAPITPAGPAFKFFKFEIKVGGHARDFGATDSFVNFFAWLVPQLAAPESLQNIDGNDLLAPFEAFRETDKVNTFWAVYKPATPDTMSWGEIAAIKVRAEVYPDDGGTETVSFARVKVTAIDAAGPPGIVLIDQDYAAGGGELNLGDRLNAAGTELERSVLLPTLRPPPAPPAYAQVDLDDRSKAVALLRHLSYHKGYYSRAILLGQDPAQRASQLQDVKLKDGSAALDHIENRPLELLGDNVAYPCVDPTWSTRLLAIMDAQAATDAEPSPVERLISLPSRGVFAEAKLGHCNASEEIDNTRFWDWQTSPIPLPATDIAPIQSVTPTPQTPAGLQPTPFPSPIVNIVNPPSEPNPTGIGAALTALTTANVFRDMSNSAGVVDLLKKLADDSVAIAQTAQASGTGTGAGTKAGATAGSGGAGPGGGAGGSSGGAGSGSSLGGGKVSGSAVGQTASLGTPQNVGEVNQLASGIRAQLPPAQANPLVDQLYRNVVDGTGADAPVIGGGSAALGQQLQQAELARRANLTAAAIAAVSPKDVTSLVSYGVEWPNGLTVGNWALPGLDHYGGSFNGHRIGGRQDGNIDPLQSYPIRILPRGIVLHETVGWAVVGAGVDSNATPPFGLSVHFSVGPQGTVYQHNDIAQVLDHASKANGQTIGIEMTSGSVIEKANPAPLSVNPTLKSSQLHSLQTGAVVGDSVTDDRPRVPISWIDGKSNTFVYVLPSQAQLEGLTQLVSWLCSGTTLTAEATFLNVNEQSHWRQHVVQGAGTATVHWFLPFHNPAWTANTFTDFDGIFAHANFDNNRKDGGPVGLYAWLRLYCGAAPSDAYQTLQTLISDPLLVSQIQVAPSAMAWAINVSSVVPATVNF